jgi:hypothetical protein
MDKGMRAYARLDLQQIARACLREQALKRDLTGTVLHRPATVLRKRRVTPWSILHRQADKLPEQQLVAELLDEHALAAHPVEHLQYKCTQQLVRRNRDTVALGGTSPRNSPIQSFQRFVEQITTGHSGCPASVKLSGLLIVYNVSCMKAAPRIMFVL